MVPDKLRGRSSRAAASGCRWEKATGWWSATACGWRTRAGRTAAAEASSEVIDRRSLLSPAMLRLTQWIADIICALGARCWRRSCRRGSAARRARG